MTAKKRLPLSNKEEEKKWRIWQFVLEHEGFFCDPPPEGLGFPRPGMIPGYYLERDEEWKLDSLRVLNLKRAKQVRDEAMGASTASAGTASAGMAPETRGLLDSIRRMDADGLLPERIATELGISPDGVRNVLNLGQRAYDPGVHGPAQLPELVSFRESWGRNGPWHGGKANGNGDGHRNGAL